MRLSDESVIEGGHLTLEERIALQAEEIKQLQQENNDWQERYYELDVGHSRLFKDFCKLQQENEQLQAQVARMKEALELYLWYGSEGLCIDEKLARKIMKALRPDSGTDYHNPTKRR